MKAAKRKWPALCAVALAVGLPLLPPAAVTSVYSRGLYPILQRVVVPLTGCSGVLFTASLMVAVAACGVFALSRGRRSCPTRPGATGRRLGTRLRRIAWVLWTLWVWFLLMWGLGYRQEPVEERWGLTATEPPGAADLDSFTDALVGILSTEPPHRDEARAFGSVKRSLQRWIAREDGFTPAMPLRVKTLPSGVLSTSGFTGIVSPFLLEAHLDGALSPTDRVAVGAHELAHLCGINGEADADAVGLLAGLSADDPYARYCVALRAFGIVGNDLGPLLFKRRFDELPEFARRDYLERLGPLRRQRSETASAVVRAVYDGYLKSQGVREGVADYGRAVELVLRARRVGKLDL